MTKEEFFKKINNPLDNDELLRTVLEAYYNNESIYTKINKVNATEEDKESGKYFPEIRDSFYLYMFNIWKKAVLNKKPEEIKEKYRKQLNNIQIKLKEFNPKTEKEIRKFIYNSNKIFDKETEDFLDKFSFISQGNFSGWDHFSKKYLTFFNTEIPKIKHRLYLNINSTYIEKFAKLFTEKCMRDNLPFYYKYDDFAARADTFVIYSDTKNLFKYIDILEEIKKENKNEIEENIKKPPILTANIDNWIGYGSEPQLEEKTSYTSIREKSFEKVLNNFNKSWTNSHKNKSVTVKGNKIPYKTFLAELIYDTYIKDFNKRIERYENNETKLNKVDQYSGFSLNDTKKEGFRKALKENIYLNMDIILENIDNPNNIDKNKLHKMTTRIKDIYFTISPYDIKKALKRQPMILSRESKDFYDQFRGAIKRDAKNYNISEENYCFDKTVLEELKQYSKTEEQIKAEEKKSIEKDPEKKAEKKKPTIKNIEINNKKINNTNKTVINKEDKANNKTITLKEEQKQEEKDNKTSYEKPHKVINPEKAKINEKLLRTLGIVINGNIYINGGTVNITINNYRRSNNETLRRTK